MGPDRAALGRGREHARAVVDRDAFHLGIDLPRGHAKKPPQQVGVASLFVELEVVGRIQLELSVVPPTRAGEAQEVSMASLASQSPAVAPHLP